VGRPTTVTGEAVCAFVVLKGARPSGERGAEIAKELRDWVARRSALSPSQGHPLRDNLPKTRSGKIMRRLLRSIGEGRGDQRQDVSTLEIPGILEQLSRCAEARALRRAAKRSFRKHAREARPLLCSAAAALPFARSQI